MSIAIAISEKDIQAFCERHHIQRLALFGSVLTDGFSRDSDVDVLVEFDSAHIPGWEFVTMQDELSQILGYPVDLNTPGFLSESFRDDVLAGAVVLYEK